MWVTQVVKPENRNNNFKLINYNWKYINALRSYVTVYEYRGLTWFYGQDACKR